MAQPPNSKHWTVREDVQLLSLMHRDQARIFRGLQRNVLKRVKRRQATEPLSDSDLDELSKISTFLKRATSDMIALNDARAKLAGESDTDVLLEQLRHEFVLAVRTFTDDEVTIMAKNMRAEQWDVFARVRPHRKLSACIEGAE